MATKEGKNARFARRVCELLKPHLDADFEYIGEPVHILRQKTRFGYRSASVTLEGACAPYRSLEFSLGVWHDAYEATRLRLGMEPSTEDVPHFYLHTGFFSHNWPGYKGDIGRWEANLNQDPARVMPQVIPDLSHAMELFHGACARLRTVRKLLFDDLLRSQDHFWQAVVVLDTTLKDWKHLAAFIQNKECDTWSADPKLIKKIESVYDIKLSAFA